MNTKQRDDEAAKRILSRVTRYSSDWSEVTKTLGQINAEAHEDESVDWDMMSDWYKSCWQAAAEAVVAEVNAGVLRTVSVKNDRERAVIEAAKVCVGASGDWGRKLTP